MSGKAALVRKGLKLDTGKNQGSLVIRMRSSSETQVNIWANGKSVGKTTVAAGKDYTDYRLLLKETAWTGTINNLKIDFSSQRGTTVAIDSIRVTQ